MRGTLILLLCAPLLAGSTWLLRNDSDVQAGQDAYKKRDFASAAASFRRALGGEGDSDVAQFDLGTAWAQEGMRAREPRAKERALTHALVSLQGALNSSRAELRLRAQYNLGNVFVLANRYEEAIEAYKKVLREDSSHDAARHNLELAQLLRLSELSLSQVTDGNGTHDLSSESSESSERQADSPQGEHNANNRAPGKGHSPTAPGKRQSLAARQPSPGPDSKKSESRAGTETLGQQERLSQEPGAKPVMRASPRVMSDPDQEVSTGLLQKLDALERLSGELRRKQVLHHTQSMVRATATPSLSPASRSRSANKEHRRR